MQILWIALLLQLLTPSGCESRHAYFDATDEVCLLPADMDESQALLFEALTSLRSELGQLLHDQREITVPKVGAAVAAFDVRIAFLEAKRDSTSGASVRAYQVGIDRITDARVRLNARLGEAPGFGLTISRLNREIGDLRRDLDASIS